MASRTVLGLVAPRDLDVGALARLEALLHALVARAPLVVHRGAAQVVDRAVVDDAQHPRAHGAAVAVVAGAGAPDAQERLLGDVLGAVAGADDPVGERERRRGVALVDDLERRRLPAAHELHEVLVGEARVGPWPSGRAFAPARRADQSASASWRRVLEDAAAPRARRRAACARRGRTALCAWARRLWRWRRVRRSTSPAPAPAPTTTAAAGRNAARGQLRGSRIEDSSHASSSSAASSTSVPRRALHPHGELLGRLDRRQRRLQAGLDVERLAHVSLRRSPPS